MKNKFFRLLSSLMLMIFLSACNLLNTFFSANTPSACNVSLRDPDHPVAEQMVAPTGRYPVWFVTFDSIAMSELGRSLPPYNGGTIRKSLMVVSTDIESDLIITGHQLDGDGVVLFPVQIDEEIEDADGVRTIIYSDDDLSDRKIIPNAQMTTNSTQAPGYASHPWSAYYPSPGCYEIIGAYGGYTSYTVVEVRDE